MSTKAAVIKNRTGKVVFLYPEQLEVRPGFNVRYEMGDITQLSKSIKENGITDPLRGYPAKRKTDDGWPIYIVTDGHRRFAAAQRIADKMEEGDFIPFIEEPAGQTEDQRIVDMLTTGENKKPLNLLETARGIKRLLDNGWKQSEIAKKVGKSPMFVSDCVKLMTDATDLMIKQMETGQIAPYTLIEMLKAGTADKVEKAIGKTIAKTEETTGTGKSGRIKASQIEEESGEPMTAKGKIAAKVKAEKKAPAEKEPTMDATLESLVNLRTALKAQEGTKKEEAFGILNALIKLGKGKTTPIELLGLFFEEDLVAAPEAEAEDEVEEEEAPKPKKKVAAVKKKNAAPVKSAAKKTKKAIIEDEPADEDLDELDEDGSEEDDDDFEE